MPHLFERRAELPLGTADVQYPTRGGFAVTAASR
jgi:hypothetical protein